MLVVVLVVDVLVVVLEVEVLLEVDVDVLVEVVVIEVDVLVVSDMVVVVEVEVEDVVPATEYHELPSYLFHSFSVESKYVSPSTGVEGCELSTCSLPENLPNLVIFTLLYFFL